MLEEHIEKIRPYILELLSNDATGHDVGHLERTMKIALYLQEKEGGDRKIIGISAFMHDIHRAMQKEKGEYVSPKDSLDTVREILANTNLTKEELNEICYCIENHELYNWNGNNVEDINALIVQDADNLDAIGAIGIGRTFKYSGYHDVAMYDDKVPLKARDDYEEGKNSASVIHHFYDKLFKHKDYMNTKTAKDIAIKRTEFMESFVKEFLKEWEGKI